MIDEQVLKELQDSALQAGAWCLAVIAVVFVLVKTVIN
jgi:hypothetical protein